MLLPRRRRLAGAEHDSRVSQFVHNGRSDRVRATKYALRNPCRVLERRCGLAEIIERGAVVPVEGLRIIPPHRERPLVPKDVGGAKLTGELKLRFHLKRAHLLEGLDEACRQELIAHPAAYIRVLNRHTSYEPAAW